MRPAPTLLAQVLPVAALLAVVLQEAALQEAVLPEAVPQAAALERPPMSAPMVFTARRSAAPLTFSAP